MPLSPGSRLGPYEILKSIGAGGMGEVFRARDTRLNRDVAVKVLPQSFAKDPDRLRRFTLEAQAASSLNHPNILAVYDIGEHEGISYIVSELLEGESLRARLRGGKLSVPKAVEYARQTALGLAAAHAKGITHRDIKPENLFIVKDGHVKILDFGLAKVMPSHAVIEESQTETQTAATSPGVVLGTAGYMSPEQVRGETVDHRSDIFSFGSVLYEMLTGRRAFSGQSPVETMNAILNGEPPDLAAPESALPPALERVVRHCLEKRPEERFQSAGDVAFDLEALAQTSGRAAAKGGVPRGNWRLGWALALAFLVLVAGVAGFFAGKRSERRPVPKFQRLTFRRGFIPAARFAPDGNSVVYGAAWDGGPSHVYSARRDSPDYHPTVAPEASLLSVSQTGELALLLKPRAGIGWVNLGTLARVPFSGGAPREVLQDVQYADWAPSGELAVVRRGEKGDRIEFPVGKVLFESAGMITHPRFSPSGDRIAFLHHPTAVSDAGDVRVMSLSGETRTLSAQMTSIWGLAWNPGTGEIWFTACPAGARRELLAVTLAGAVRTVLAQTTNLTLEDISRDGRVLLNPTDFSSRLYFGGVEGQAGRDLSWLDWSLAGSISAGGKAIVLGESGEGAGQNWVSYYRKTDGSPAVRLGEIAWPRLSPDERSVLGVNPAGDGLVVVPVGPGETRRIPLPGFKVSIAALLPGDRGFLFTGSEPGRGIRLYRVDGKGDKPRPLTPEGVGVRFIASPGGGFAANVNEVTGQLMIYPLAGGEPAVCAGREPGEGVQAWTAEEDSLFVMRREGLPGRVYRVNWRTGRRELVTEIIPPDPAGFFRFPGFAITPDGRWYAYSYIQQLSVLHVVEGLR